MTGLGTKFTKLLAVTLVAATLTIASEANAAWVECGNNSRITNVYLGYYTWQNSKEYGFRAIDSNGTVLHFISRYSNMNIADNVEARLIYQTILAAFASGSKVTIYALNDCVGTNIKGVNWIDAIVGVGVHQ